MIWLQIYNNFFEKETNLSLFFFGGKKTIPLFFFGAKKRGKRNIHPNPSIDFVDFCRDSA